jgi:hypothetical protein
MRGKVSPGGPCFGQAPLPGRRRTVAGERGKILLPRLLLFACGLLAAEHCLAQSWKYDITQKHPKDLPSWVEVRTEGSEERPEAGQVGEGRTVVIGSPGNMAEAYAFLKSNQLKDKEWAVGAEITFLDAPAQPEGTTPIFQLWHDEVPKPGAWSDLEKRVGYGLSAKWQEGKPNFITLDHGTLYSPVIQPSVNQTFRFKIARADNQVTIWSGEGFKDEVGRADVGEGPLVLTWGFPGWGKDIATIGVIFHLLTSKDLESSSPPDNPQPGPSQGLYPDNRWKPSKEDALTLFIIVLLFAAAYLAWNLHQTNRRVRQLAEAAFGHETDNNERDPSPLPRHWARVLGRGGNGHRQASRDGVPETRTQRARPEGLAGRVSQCEIRLGALQTFTGLPDDCWGLISEGTTLAYQVKELSVQVRDLHQRLKTMEPLHQSIEALQKLTVLVDNVQELRELTVYADDLVLLARHVKVLEELAGKAPALETLAQSAIEWNRRFKTSRPADAHTANQARPELEPGTAEVAALLQELGGVENLRKTITDLVALKQELANLQTTLAALRSVYQLIQESGDLQSLLQDADEFCTLLRTLRDVKNAANQAGGVQHLIPTVHDLPGQSKHEGGATVPPDASDRLPVPLASTHGALPPPEQEEEPVPDLERWRRLSELLLQEAQGNPYLSQDLELARDLATDCMDPQALSPRFFDTLLRAARILERQGDAATVQKEIDRRRGTEEGDGQTPPPTVASSTGSLHPDEQDENISDLNKGRAAAPRIRRGTLTLEETGARDRPFQVIPVEPVQTAPGAEFPAKGQPIEASLPWHERWKRLRECLDEQAPHVQDGNLVNEDLETLDSYWNALVEQWKDRQHPAEDPAGWGNWWLDSMDLHLYQEVELVSLDLSLPKEVRSTLKDLMYVIEEGQQERKRQLREQFGVQRIEGVQGKSEVKAHELEMDPQHPCEPTTDPQLDGKLCRIVPGRGGYRCNGDVLRPTYAVFYCPPSEDHAHKT